MQIPFLAGISCQSHRDLDSPIHVVTCKKWENLGKGQNTMSFQKEWNHRSMKPTNDLKYQFSLR